MKRFLRLFAVWSLIGVLFASVLDVMITSGLRRIPVRKYVVWNDIYQKNLDADLLVIGSSRAWCGYSTYVLDSLLQCDSYNLGLDGHPLDFQLLRYYTYRRYNGKPSVVLVNTDFLSTLNTSAQNQYEREQFFPYIDDRVLINSVARDKHIGFAERFIPLYRYFGYREDMENGLASFFGKTDFPDSGMHKGYRGNDYGWSRGDLLGRDSTIVMPVNYNLADTLASFTRRTLQEGIRLVFVKSPVYRPLIGHFSNVSESDSIFAEISHRFDVPLLDNYASPVSSDSTNFYNPSHLNTKGSELFTRMLCADLETILETTE